MSAPLDRDGYPPCTMTVEEFCAHVRETFGDRDVRICSFRVRGVFKHSTLTTKRGEMRGMSANKVQRAACEESMRKAGEGST